MSATLRAVCLCRCILAFEQKTLNKQKSQLDLVQRAGSMCLKRDRPACMAVGEDMQDMPIQWNF